MSKGGSGCASGSGPTATAAANAVTRQKSLLLKVDKDIGNIVESFNYLVQYSQNSQEALMMEMRAARMVQASDLLLQLVSGLKQTAIFSGFASLNDHVEQRIDEFNNQAEKTDRILTRIGEDAAASLKELEAHYYSSAERTGQLT